MLHRAKALSRRYSFLLSALLILPSMVRPPKVGATAEDGAVAVRHPKAPTAVLVPGIDSFSPQVNKESETNPSIDLEALLRRTAEYCQKLEGAGRNFVCREENGIRSPNHLVVEEAYIGKSGGRFVRSKTDVTYKDFRFFSVEVDVDLGR